MANSTSRSTGSTRGVPLDEKYEKGERVETLKVESGSRGVTVGQLREWLAGLPKEMLVAASIDGEGNDFNVIVEADPNVRYDLEQDRTVHECDEECAAYLQENGLGSGDDCEYTWGGPETSDSDVHVVMLWPAG